MATWKKVIVSGSSAELGQLNVGANQQINTSPASTFLSGSFSGSFFGDGSGLSGVAASFPVTAKTDLATTDKFFINDGASKFVTYGNLVTDLAGAGAGTSNLTTGDTGDSLALTAQIAVTGVTASFTGSLTGALTGTASFATSASQAVTASYVLQAVSASFATLAQTANTASYVVTAQTASYVLQAVSASFATTASYAASTNNITNAITNNVDNRILTATGGGTINGESNLTFDGTTLSVTGNATLTGNLTVAGTASFTNTDNLNIRDKFILINSGSATLSDSGWITQYNAAGSGSAFYLDAGTGNDHGPYGRFAVAFDTLGTTTSPTVSEYVVTAKINQASNPTNAVPPTWGTGSNGSGNMWITNAGDIFIYG